jgi:hypothetical protein
MRERADLIDALLRVISAPGRGTTVRLELTLHDDHVAGQPVRILLVEDHTASARLLSALWGSGDPLVL